LCAGALLAAKERRSELGADLAHVRTELAKLDEAAETTESQPAAGAPDVARVGRQQCDDK
jgi:hypothetical protein